MDQITDDKQDTQVCSGGGSVRIRTIPLDAETFTSPDDFPGLRFKDTDGDWTRIWVKDSKSYYWMAETADDFVRVPGHPLAMVRGQFHAGEVYVCPRDRMQEDGGFHSPALDWIKQEWVKKESQGR